MKWSTWRQFPKFKREGGEVTIDLKAFAGRELPREVADFVTITSGTANNLIDGASAELTTRITKQIDEIEKKRTGGSLPNTLE